MRTASTTTSTDLVRGTAHLLRTPLGVILGIAATLRDYDARFTAEQRRGYLDEVVQAAEEMRAALDGMSLLARLVDGTLALTPAPVAVSEVVQAAARGLGAVWAREVPGSAAPASGMGPHALAGDGGVVRVDLQRFEQACQALARACVPDAAVRLAAEGAPVPRLCLGPVTMRAADDGWRVLLEAPLTETIGADTVSRPENWPVVLARYLLEVQGWRLRAKSHVGGAELTLEPAPAT
jgi:signal transduction histidine kinase